MSLSQSHSSSQSQLRVSSIYRSDLFVGRVALITGGGTGIGLRTAKELVQLGATVVIASRTESVLIAAVVVLRGYIQHHSSQSVHYVVCNIRDNNSIKACVTQIKKITGRIDYLLNNAGGQYMTASEYITEKGWRAVMETNLFGPFFMAQTVFSECMKEQGSGVIVNVIANFWKGFPNMSHTGAARAGVDNLTKSLAIEWAPYGIRVCAIAPGTIASSGLSRYDEAYRAAIMESGQKFNYATRMGTEAEVCSCILFLLSPGASYMTGTTLSVDAGESLFHPFMMPTPNTHPQTGHNIPNLKPYTDIDIDNNHSNNSNNSNNNETHTNTNPNPNTPAADVSSTDARQIRQLIETKSATRAAQAAKGKENKNTGPAEGSQLQSRL